MCLCLHASLNADKAPPKKRKKQMSDDEDDWDEAPVKKAAPVKVKLAPIFTAAKPLATKPAAAKSKTTVSKSSVKAKAVASSSLITSKTKDTLVSSGAKVPAPVDLEQPTSMHWMQNCAACLPVYV
jgi:hypothetical protein